jgi:hypothetical protein
MEFIAIDCDRVAWGDPLAEWTFHLLPRKASTRARAAFWAACGARDRSLSARFRDSIYEGLHASNVLSAARRAGQEEALPKVQATLRAVVATLQVLLV